MKWDAVRQAREVLAAEEGTIIKDWGGRLPIALVYANSYYVGMSSLGLQTLYRLLNRRPDVAAERVFWSEDRPPFALESQEPLANLAVIAATISFELDILHLVDMLRQAGLPVLAAERDEDAPLVLAGGPVPTANPELLAPIVDAAFVGEAEEELDRLVDVLVETAAAPLGERRAALARLPGLYVPGQSPLPVSRLQAADLDRYPAHSTVLTRDTEFGDMYLIEVSRGCSRGCRFCLAGRLYRPLRQRSVPVILEQAREGLKHRRTLGLVGAAVSDYREIDSLLAGLDELGADIAVSSLRVDPLPESLLAALARSGTQTLTLAPEAGSERMRRLVRKGVTEAQVLSAAERADSYGFPQLKLYFMVGLPDETEEDVEAIVELTRAVKARFRRRITVHVTPFVPKPHTAFQRRPMASAAELDARIKILSRALRPAGVALRAEGTAWARVQGVLARGDRTLGAALARLQAPTLAGWRRMVRQTGLDEQAYLGARAADEELPWNVVQ